MVSKYVVVLAALCIFGSMCGAQSGSSPGQQGSRKPVSSAGSQGSPGSSSNHHESSGSSTISGTSSISNGSTTSSEVQSSGSVVTSGTITDSVTTYGPNCSEGLQSMLNTVRHRLELLETSPAISTEISQQWINLEIYHNKTIEALMRTRSELQRQQLKLSDRQHSFAEDSHRFQQEIRKYEEARATLGHHQQAQLMIAQKRTFLEKLEAELYRLNVNLMSRVENLKIGESLLQKLQRDLDTRNSSLELAESTFQQWKNNTQQTLVQTIRREFTELITWQTTVHTLEEQISQVTEQNVVVTKRKNVLLAQLEELKGVETKAANYRKEIASLQEQLRMKRERLEALRKQKFYEIPEYKGILDGLSSELERLSNHLKSAKNAYTIQAANLKSRQVTLTQREILFAERQKHMCRPDVEKPSITTPAPRPNSTPAPGCRWLCPRATQ